MNFKLNSLVLETNTPELSGLTREAEFASSATQQRQRKPKLAWHSVIRVDLAQPPRDSQARRVGWSGGGGGGEVGLGSR